MAALAPAIAADVVTSEQCILAIEFRSQEGRSWHAIGGGPSVAAAIGYARESCPSDAIWYAVSWEDVYGD
jgi:hypothetical protein